MKSSYQSLSGALLILTGVCCNHAFASEPTVDELRREWSRIFPQPDPAKQAPRIRTAPDLYSILEKEFLLIRPFNYPGSTLSRSLRTIRDYPAPLQKAHAACVKIITPSWQGAGIVISPDGDILTSYHLIAGMPGASIITLEGRVYSVTNILAHSIVHDLALLKIPAETPVFLSLDRGALPAPGTRLQIVGHPGDTSWKLSTGTVIRHYRDGKAQVLHFDADIGPGNSGGPIVDDQGRLCAITACSAQLTDGSKVKVGVDLEAIREFMATPCKPTLFSDLAVLEKNRRMTDFLGELYLCMADSIQQWLATMALATFETTPAATLSAYPQLRLTAPRQAGTTATKLLLLRILMTHCAQMEELDPRLYQSMADTAASMTLLIDGLASVQIQASPEKMKNAMREIARHNDGARLLFGKALEALEETGQDLSLTFCTPPQQEQVCSLRETYFPAGCHVNSNPRNRN